MLHHKFQKNPMEQFGSIIYILKKLTANFTETISLVNSVNSASLEEK